MRGDSVRDLYAKTLAVMGLGLLAGAGAVVDYWPVGGTMPAVSAAVLPSLDAPVLAQNLSLQIPAPDLTPRVASRTALHLTMAGSRLFLAAAAPVESPPAAVPTPPVPAPTPSWEIAPVESAIPEALSVSLIDVGLVTTAPTDDSGDSRSTGLIGGAIRKTRDSLVRTGAATRSSLADAVRGVVGAFKKVTPF